MSDPRPDSEPSRARGDADTHTGGDHQSSTPPSTEPATTPPKGDHQAEHHQPLGTHSDGSDRVYPGLGPAAIRWLEHRAEVSKRHGYAFATVAEAEDINGSQLLRMQQKPGFDDCVDKMLRLDDARWGKSLRGGIAYLARMVHDWIQPSPKGNGRPPNRQAHLVGETLTPAEYAAKTGHDPREAPILDTPEARAVMEACGAGA